MSHEIVVPVPATATITIGFPKGEINCNHCKFCLENRYNREMKYCNLWDFIIANPRVMDGRCLLDLYEDSLNDKDESELPF